MNKGVSWRGKMYWLGLEEGQNVLTINSVFIIKRRGTYIKNKE